MSSGGLQRRRNAAGHASNGSNSIPSDSAAAAGGSSVAITSTSTTDGPRIAFDPRDLPDSAEEKTKPKLTLMEEVLLLGLKDKQGYLSFWNDNISYTLRGCILAELALRGKIAMVKDPNRRRFPLADRYIEVVDEKLTGEVLIDEALKMIKSSEKMSVGTWIDLMSGETWNVMKIGYQLKQVRERLAKGLVDKGILRTEKRNFLLFDMATHPVSDTAAKQDLVRRVMTFLTSRSSTALAAPSQFFPESIPLRLLRSICLVCSAYAANVLENALVSLSHEARERAYTRVDELLSEFSQWPFVTRPGDGGIGGGGAGGVAQAVVQEIGEGKDLQVEVVAATLSVLSKMDSIL